MSKHVSLLASGYSPFFGPIWRRGQQRALLGASSGPTVPPVEGYAAWYDFSDTATYYTDEGRTTPGAVGQLAGSVSDKSGNGHHLTIADALRPLHKQIAGQKSCYFNGSTYLQIPASLVLSRQACTIIVAHRVHPVTPTVALVSFGATPDIALYQNLGSFATETRLFNGAQRLTAIDATQGIAVSAGVFRTTESKAFYGSEAATFAAGSAVSPEGGYVGRWGTDSFRLNGHIYEVLVYTTALTDEEIQSVMDYLKTKHGGLNRTVASQFYFEGDSTTAGVDSSDPDGDVSPDFSAQRDWSWPLMIMRGQSAPPKFFNGGAGGDTAAAMAAATNPIGYLSANEAAYPTKTVLVMMGTNDIAVSTATATIQGYHDTFIANIRAAHATAFIIGCTILPRNPFNETQDQQIDDVNDHIRNVADYDGVIDFDNVPEVLLKSNTTYYPDGVHPSRALKTLMAAYAETRLVAMGRL